MVFFGFEGELQGDEVGLACLHAMVSDPPQRQSKKVPSQPVWIAFLSFFEFQEHLRTTEIAKYYMGVTCSQHFGRRTPAVAATLCICTKARPTYRQRTSIVNTHLRHLAANITPSLQN
jgi:hypothetical protein